MLQPTTAAASTSAGSAHDLHLVLDQHSARISQATMAGMATHPGRFESVPAPRHGTRLNRVESASSKIARSFLCQR